MYLFIFGCAGSLLLHMGFLYCGERGLFFAERKLLFVVQGLLITTASHIAEHGL